MKAKVSLRMSPECLRAPTDLSPRSWAQGPRSSSYSLDYELHREDSPCRVYEHQGVPPLLHRVPVRIWRAHLGTGAKGRFSPHRAPRKSQLPPEIKLQTEELHCLRAELSHIKAQVDRLLQRVELMEQRRDQLPGTEVCEQNRGSGSQGSLCRTTEPRQKPRGPRALPEADGSQEHTDPEDAVSGLAPPPSSPSLFGFLFVQETTAAAAGRRLTSVTDNVWKIGPCPIFSP
ncbi:uncharacterized protein ACBT57_009202 isoform 1-T1 [Dama dama]|uniref:uncharacterized protein LOC133052873 isoform X1 n=1 Tax=Dama dama TaxID=30532 RepID=UPI002A36F391|nr:uncharacterized protein LOC133052873 isoform X1 [Dama dama]